MLDDKFHIRVFTIFFRKRILNVPHMQGRIYRGGWGGLQPPLQLVHQWKMGRVREKKRWRKEEK
jgi:hypothetical protein